MATATAAKNVGKVTQVIGSTFDVQFPEQSLPATDNAEASTTAAPGASAAATATRRKRA